MILKSVTASRSPIKFPTRTLTASLPTLPKAHSLVSNSPENPLHQARSVTGIRLWALKVTILLRVASMLYRLILTGYMYRR